MTFNGLSGKAPKRKAWERKLWEKVKLAMSAVKGHGWQVRANRLRVTGLAEHR